MLFTRAIRLELQPSHIIPRQLDVRILPGTCNQASMACAFPVGTSTFALSSPRNPHRRAPRRGSPACGIKIDSNWFRHIAREVANKCAETPRPQQLASFQARPFRISSSAALGSRACWCHLCFPSRHFLLLENGETQAASRGPRGPSSRSEIAYPPLVESWLLRITLSKCCSQFGGPPRSSDSLSLTVCQLRGAL